MTALFYILIALMWLNGAMLCIMALENMVRAWEQKNKTDLLFSTASAIAIIATASAVESYIF